MCKLLKQIQFQNQHIQIRTNNAPRHIKRQNLSHSNLHKHLSNNRWTPMTFTIGPEHSKQNLFQRRHIRNNFHRKHKNKRINGKNNIVKNYYNHQNIRIQWNIYKVMTNLHNRNNNSSNTNTKKTGNNCVLNQNKFQILMQFTEIKYKNYKF